MTDVQVCDLCGAEIDEEISGEGEELVCEECAAEGELMRAAAGTSRRLGDGGSAG